MYLNVIQCLWSFSWTLAVSPNCDKRPCTNIFFFSLFFFPFLSLCLCRQSWQHSIDLEIWLIHFFLSWSMLLALMLMIAAESQPSSTKYLWEERLPLTVIFDFGSCFGSCLLQVDSASALYATSVLRLESLAVPILQMGFWETGGIMPNASKILSGG